MLKLWPMDRGVTYEVNDRMTIYASGLNITDETVHVYGLTEDQVLQAVQGGARYDVALRYKLFKQFCLNEKSRF